MPHKNREACLPMELGVENVSLRKEGGREGGRMETRWRGRGESSFTPDVPEFYDTLVD